MERLQDVTEDGAKAEGAIDNRGFIHSPENEYDRIYTAESILLKSGTVPSKNQTLTGMDGTQILTFS